MKTYLSIPVLLFLLILSGCNSPFLDFDSLQTAKIKVKLNLKVGDIVYHNADAIIHAAGYDAQNNKQWAKDFSYVGPEANTLSLTPGFHHYTFEVRKFGISETTTLTSQQLENGHLEGPSPQIFVIEGAIAAKRPFYTITYLEMPDEQNPGSSIMVPESKTDYHYNSSEKIDRITYFTYYDSIQDFGVNRLLLFNYEQGKVQKITSQLSPGNTVNTEYFYQYLADGDVSKILEANIAAGVNTQATFTYQKDSMVNVTFSSSNNQKFQYNFIRSWGNIVSDKVTRWGQLCNEGLYNHDKNINPFSHLGYVNFTLSDYSINNVLVEMVDYFACAFPELIPVSHEYEYDEDGYPTVATTTYKHEGGPRRQLRYYYLE